MPGAIAEDARSRPPKTGCFVRPVPLRSAGPRGQSRTLSGTAEPRSPGSNHPPGLKCNTTNESWKFKSAGGVCGPLSRRRKGSARGDFQGENRGPMVQDVPLARSRSGGFLSEGSPQGRMGHGPRTPPALLNPPVVVGVLDSKILSTITFRTSEEDTVLS